MTSSTPTDGLSQIRQQFIDGFALRVALLQRGHLSPKPARRLDMNDYGKLAHALSGYLLRGDFDAA
jgi:hypothetical protein